MQNKSRRLFAVYWNVDARETRLGLFYDRKELGVS